LSGVVRALARVNLAAIERNAALLAGRLRDGASLCAVVKADGYGHGAVRCARAALAGGAARLAVATAGEAAELRAAGIAAPVLVMGALSDAELPVAVRSGAEVVAWDARFVRSLERLGTPAVVHVKLDTGMGRLGTRDVDAALALADLVAGVPGLTLAGAMTHFATADDEDESFMREQLARFLRFARALRERHPGVALHAANSAATLRLPEAHLDFVRCGIAVYGLDPMNIDAGLHGLEPALELRSYVAAVKPAAPGDSAGYGRRFVAERGTVIGTLPIGYADGVRRALSNACDVLVDGRRYPLVGTVSMDNVTIELGPDPGVAAGAPAVLIGASGRQRQTAEDLARRIGTINYEITCGIGARVPREYHRDGAPA
jgi:alanine racemase